MEDIVKFQQENVKGRTYHYCILGDIEDLYVFFNDAHLDSSGRTSRASLPTTECFN